MSGAVEPQRMDSVDRRQAFAVAAGQRGNHRVGTVEAEKAAVGGRGDGECISGDCAAFQRRDFNGGRFDFPARIGLQRELAAGEIGGRRKLDGRLQ